MISLNELKEDLSTTTATESIGRIVSMNGQLIRVRIPYASVGNLCEIERPGLTSLRAQVVGFDGELATLSVLDRCNGVAAGLTVRSSAQNAVVKFNPAQFGQILDPLGKPLLKSNSAVCSNHGVALKLMAQPPNPMERKRISEQFFTGIKSIDGLCSLAAGQRMGLFAGPGIGKSTLLGMIARNSSADVNVIALIGERGREVREFVEDALGEEGLKKSILIVATSDETPIRRKLAACTATAIAEHYRACGKNVLLLFDSLTRYARAVRDVGFSSGELPVRQGYTPSVYTEMPELLERAGCSAVGSITAIYTVLTANFDEMDALSEEVKSLLDGHIVLSNTVAAEGIRPAVDIERSVSRLMNAIHTPEYLKVVSNVVKMIHTLRESKELLALGGSLDEYSENVIKLEGEIKNALNQGIQDTAQIDNTREMFRELSRHLIA